MDNQEVQQLKDELIQIQKMESIGKLSGGIAHDFNNILGSIHGFAEVILQSYSTDPKLMRFGNHILAACKRGTELTGKLMNFARKGPADQKAVKLHSLLGETISLLEHTLEKNISIEKDFAPDPLLFMCDQAQMQNALLNVAINARDAMPEGGVLRFTTRVEKGGPCESGTSPCVARLTISDTGIGISEENRKHLFEPFFTTKKGKGTGLGLVGVYRCIHDHNGKIEIESQVGRGTSFHLILPLVGPEPGLEKTSQTAPFVAPVPLSCPRLMVVDDDEMLLSMYKEVLQDRKVEFHLFSRGLEAVEFYASHHDDVDVILLDMVMPGMNGRECFYRFRSINPGAKIILFSGYAPTTDTQELIRLGAVHLTKPVRFEELFSEMIRIGPLPEVSPSPVASPVSTESGARIVVVDDDPSFVALIHEILGDKGFNADIFTCPKECLEALPAKVYKLAVVDFKMPNINGLELIAEMRKVLPDISTLLLTGISEDEAIKTRARKQNVNFFAKKPLDLLLFGDVLKKTFPKEVRTVTPSGLHSKGSADQLLVGESAVMAETHNLIRKVAATDANLIIFGETGTGKELAARTIHQESLRSSGAFIPVNCASLPDNLLESELFGHEKGAFSGAVQTKKGLFEWAHNGTLFLDEIGDLNYPLQAKLLRAIQERRIRRVGGRDELEVNVRIISATNRNLEEMILEKSFREDLFYRLNVIKLVMLPLRERREDVPRLVDHFITKFNNRDKTHRVKSISSEALSRLMEYDFPGNVRELENMISEAFVMCHGETISVRELPKILRHLKGGLQKKKGETPVSMEQFIESSKKEYIQQLMSRHKGRVVECAKEAGMNRASFYRVISHFKINPLDFRD